MTNKELIAKIDRGLASVADLGAGGYLNPMQSDRFIQGIIDEPTIMNECRTVMITGEHKRIEKIGFGNRIMRPGVEGGALAEGDYSKPQYGKVDLYTREAIAETRISYDTIESNIERGNIRTTIIRLLQQRIALDLEELIIRGDKSSSDPYLALLDGILKKCNRWVIDLNSAAGPTIAQWTRLINAVPQKYLRQPNTWKIYTNRLTDLAWKTSVAERNTVSGDRFLLQNTNATVLGFEIKPIAMMPGGLRAGQYPPWPTTPRVPHSPYTGTAHAGGGLGDPVDTLSQALFISPQNILVGFTRRVQMEFDKDISSREVIIVTTMKVDVAIEETDAASKMIELVPTLPT